mgnify:CR=1 FL=1
MAYNKSNKRAVETFIVQKTSVAFYNSSGAGNFINNIATGAVRLTDGQVGIFDGSGNGSVALNTATDLTPVVAESPVIYLAQGTPWSASPSTPANTYPLWNIPYIKSGDINGRNPVLITKQTYATDTHSVWVVGSTVAGRGISALDNTEYQMRIGFRGRREDEYYNNEATNQLAASYTTPNYTLLGTADPVDHLIQNLTWNINRNSKAIAFYRTRFRGNAPIVALAINVAGDSNGTPIGGNGDGASGTTALATGQVVPVINTNLGVRTITLTEGMATSIKNAAVAAATEFAGSAVAIGAITWNILTIDTTTAGLTAGGVADLIMLVALDADLAFKDRIPQVKTRLQVGLTTGFDFNTVNHKQYEQPFEGHGKGRALDLIYKATMGQRLYNLNHVEDPITEFPSPIITTTNYVTYIVNHVGYSQVDTLNYVDSPQSTFLLSPTGDSTFQTAIEGSLNSWLASNGHPNIDTI